jgi:hypothetical protein
MSKIRVPIHTETPLLGTPVERFSVTPVGTTPASSLTIVAIGQDKNTVLQATRSAAEGLLAELEDILRVDDSPSGSKKPSKEKAR